VSINKGTHDDGICLTFCADLCRNNKMNKIILPAYNNMESTLFSCDEIFFVRIIWLERGSGGCF
jgi:hypothetical protein